jgi:hypothetical protein
MLRCGALSAVTAGICSLVNVVVRWGWWKLGLQGFFHPELLCPDYMQGREEDDQDLPRINRPTINPETVSSNAIGGRE